MATGEPGALVSEGAVVRDMEGRDMDGEGRREEPERCAVCARVSWFSCCRRPRTAASPRAVTCSSAGGTGKQVGGCEAATVLPYASISMPTVATYWHHMCKLYGQA